MEHSPNSESAISSLSELLTATHITELNVLALEKSTTAAHLELADSQTHLGNDISPILILPVEITSEIFMHFLPPYPEHPPLTGLYSPALLSQICQAWRDIAFSTPRLWRAVMIEMRASVKRSFPARLNILHTWLARSAHLPLSISLEVEKGIDCLDPRWADVIITHAARWERMTLVIPFGDLCWIQGPFPLLRDLTIGPSGFEDPDPAATVFHDAPLLTTVDLALGFNPPYVTLPWPQLTRISFNRCEPVHVAHILRRAVSLVELSGSLWDDFIHFEDIPPLMHLRSLILLDVDAGLEVSNKMLLDALTTPALRHLTVSERELKDECTSTIAALLSRSHCPLESLHVTHSVQSTANYHAVFPQVKVIKVFVHTEDGPYDGEEEDTGEDDEGLSEDENDYKGENLGVEGD